MTRTTSLGTRLRAYLALGKLRLSALAVFAVAAGLFLADHEPPRPLLVATLFGTLLVAVAGNAINMLIEREHDRRMPRTQSRPLPAGVLTPVQVAAFGGTCAVAGLMLLWTRTNALATGLCALIFVTYVLVYTPLKRVTAFNTLVGAFPGALPPVVGYAAATGQLDIRAGILFAILFFWQIPHFLAIASRYREDYRLGDMKMLPVVDPIGSTTAHQMVVYTLALLLVSVLGYGAGVAGPLYLIGALCLGALFLTAVLAAAISRRESTMRLCFWASIVYLPLLLAVLVVDKVPA